MGEPRFPGSLRGPSCCILIEAMWEATPMSYPVEILLHVQMPPQMTSTDGDAITAGHWLTDDVGVLLPGVLLPLHGWAGGAGGHHCQNIALRLPSALPDQEPGGADCQLRLHSPGQY